MTFYELRPKILEDSLTLSPETCPLGTVGVTVQSRQGHTKQGLREDLSRPSDPSAVTHPWRDSHLSHGDLFISLFANKIQNSTPLGLPVKPFTDITLIVKQHLGQETPLADAHCGWEVHLVHPCVCSTEHSAWLTRMRMYTQPAENQTHD